MWVAADRREAGIRRTRARPPTQASDISSANFCQPRLVRRHSLVEIPMLETRQASLLRAYFLCTPPGVCPPWNLPMRYCLPTAALDNALPEGFPGHRL